MKPTVLQKIYRRIEIFIEKLNGLDFSTVKSVSELGLDERLVVQGSPSCNKYLLDVLSDLEVEYGDSILDIGCAKGSAIRCMLRYPFKKIAGIEIAEEYVNIANKNFERLNRKNIEIICEDAVNFDNYGSFKFYYLYNPFPSQVMRKVIRKIASQAGNDKKYIIYNNPVAHEEVVKSGFVKIKDYPDMWGNGINLYSN